MKIKQATIPDAVLYTCNEKNVNDAAIFFILWLVACNTYIFTYFVCRSRMNIDVFFVLVIFFKVNL